VPTHFIAQIDDRAFRAFLLKMIPIELVTRRIATGSFLKRNPKTIEGTIFDELVTEFFLKDDLRHDPLMLWNGERQCFELYDAKLPLRDGYLGELPEFLEIPKTLKEVRHLRDISIKVFSILETAWAKQGVSLVDLKIECGYGINGVVFVGDVIDNDSWRIWPEGKKELSPDKQVYRELENVTPETLDSIKKNYTWVAEATAKFL
jgi:phosphoribosylaminoimidazole carboxylase/phosphoribosylaminoimidazole-succinocarboxamide synthase